MLFVCSQFSDCLLLVLLFKHKNQILREEEQIVRIFTLFLKNLIFMLEKPILTNTIDKQTNERTNERTREPANEPANQRTKDDRLHKRE